MEKKELGKKEEDARVRLKDMEIALQESDITSEGLKTEIESLRAENAVCFTCSCFSSLRRC